MPLPSSQPVTAEYWRRGLAEDVPVAGSHADLGTATSAFQSLSPMGTATVMISLELSTNRTMSFAINSPHAGESAEIENRLLKKGERANSWFETLRAFDSETLSAAILSA